MKLFYPLRKLGYSDRLFGSIRNALKNGVTSWLLARGALAALKFVLLEGISLDGIVPVSAAEKPASADLDPAAIRAMLKKIWENDPADEYREDCIRLIVQTAAKEKEGRRD